MFRQVKSINQRNKHIDVTFHYKRDCVEQNKVRLEKVDSQDQAADSLTKPLLRLAHERIMRLQGLTSRPF